MSLIQYEYHVIETKKTQLNNCIQLEDAAHILGEFKVGGYALVEKTVKGVRLGSQKRQAERTSK